MGEFGTHLEQLLIISTVRLRRQDRLGIPSFMPVMRRELWVALTLFAEQVAQLDKLARSPSFSGLGQTRRTAAIESAFFFGAVMEWLETKDSQNLPEAYTGRPKDSGFALLRLPSIR